MNQEKHEQVDGKVFIRTLLYIPIIHTQADMGTFREKIKQAKIKKLGQQQFKDSASLVDKLWTNIEHAINDLPSPYRKVRVYQDGLPICGRELEIVTELAQAGNRNHILLLEMKKKGAAIMGTESPDLLVEEYQLIKQIFGEKKPQEITRFQTYQKSLSLSILKKRDEFIANQINNTLCSGEMGILFIGMLHSLVDKLNEDIRVVYLNDEFLPNGVARDEKK
ncbi:MAG: hypothetical protein FD167_3046 [bacterium]|nr:MAG: hypothetical protein FD167_3046 [bacterium]